MGHDQLVLATMRRRPRVFLENSGDLADVPGGGSFTKNGERLFGQAQKRRGGDQIPKKNEV